jgi:hypothetical protein
MTLISHRKKLGVKLIEDGRKTSPSISNASLQETPHGERLVDMAQILRHYISQL